MKSYITFDQKTFSTVLDTVQKNIISSFLIMCAFSGINIILFFSGTQSIIVTIFFSVFIPPAWIAYIIITCIKEYKGVYVLRRNEKDPAVLQLVSMYDMLEEKLEMCTTEIFRMEHETMKESVLVDFKPSTDVEQRIINKKKLILLLEERDTLRKRLEEINLGYQQSMEAKTA